MVIIEIVINSTRVMGIRVTMSCRYCIAYEVMLLFSSLKLIFVTDRKYSAVSENR